MFVKSVEATNFGMQFFPEPFEELRLASKNLAKRLLNIRGVDSVEIEEDFILVKKEEDYDWENLKPLIISVISSHKTKPEFETHYDGVDKESIEFKIIEVLNTKIRPSIQADGGDIFFESFKDGIVFIRLEGSCVGCAYSQMTLKNGVERTLRYFIPEVQEVRNA